jgi:hypothetical protein
MRTTGRAPRPPFVNGWALVVRHLADWFRFQTRSATRSGAAPRAGVSGPRLVQTPPPGWPAREAATAYAKVSFTRSACEQSVSTPASRSHALHDLALILAMPMTCNDVVQSMVPEGSVRGLHSLHTAEATGSKPVTPTRQNASHGSPLTAVARRSLPVTSEHLSTALTTDTATPRLETAHFGKGQHDREERITSPQENRITSAPTVERDPAPRSAQPVHTERRHLYHGERLIRSCAGQPAGACLAGQGPPRGVALPHERACLVHVWSRPLRPAGRGRAQRARVPAVMPDLSAEASRRPVSSGGRGLANRKPWPSR